MICNFEMFSNESLLEPIDCLLLGSLIDANVTEDLLLFCQESKESLLVKSLGDGKDVEDLFLLCHEYLV